MAIIIAKRFAKIGNEAKCSKKNLPKSVVNDIYIIKMPVEIYVSFNFIVFIVFLFKSHASSMS